jgi:hypothetical protein
VEDALCRAGFPEAERDGQVHLLGEHITEVVDVQGGLVEMTARGRSSLPRLQSDKRMRSSCSDTGRSGRR